MNTATPLRTMTSISASLSCCSPNSDRVLISPKVRAAKCAAAWAGSVTRRPAAAGGRQPVREQRRQRPALGPHLAQRGEVRGLGEHQPQQGGPLRRPEGHPDNFADETVQRPFRRGRVRRAGGRQQPPRDPGDLIHEHLVGVGDDGDEQPFLVAVVVVDGALRHARLGGDGVHAGPLVAVADEQVERGAGDDGTLGLRPCPGGGAGGCARCDRVRHRLPSRSLPSP